MSKPTDILIFPKDVNLQEAIDAKQYLAAQRSLVVLKRSIEESTEYGAGYTELLNQRVTETLAIINKIEAKYKDS